MPTALLLLLACAEPPAPAAAAPVDWTDPTADDDWTGLVPSTPIAPTWGIAEIEAQFDLAFEGGLPTPHEALATYLELLTHGDADCPGSEFNQGFAVFGLCTSAEGYSYSGAAGLLTTDERTYLDDGSWTGYYSTFSAPADYFIIRPDGTRLSAGGTFNLNDGNRGSGAEWRSSITGSWQDSGHDGWLKEGYSGTLFYDGSRDVEGNAVQNVRGTITVNGVSVAMESVRVDATQCRTGFVSGTFYLRQPDTSWFTLILPTGCSTCGTVTWEDGSTIGEACLDPRPFFSVIDLTSTPE